MARTNRVHKSSALLAVGLEQNPEYIVTRDCFEFGDFRTRQGETIGEARFGWESYGELNAAGDNAILINHFMLGFGHAAGRYSEDERYPGFWDHLIGPGKAIDTRKYFVISMDCLCNAYPFNPVVRTTGPTSIDPRTGEPYGMRFPIISIKDIVNAQMLLLDNLGIGRLHAVMGAGFGGFLTYELATAWPDRVDRIIPICATLESDGWAVAWMNAWGTPIRLDPAWNKGDYHRDNPPTAGLIEAMKLVYLNARHWGALEKPYGRTWADPDRDPMRSLTDRYLVEVGLHEASVRRARFADANHFLYLVKAIQTFQIGDGEPVERAITKLKARVLMSYTPHDEIFAGPSLQNTLALLMRAGTKMRLIRRDDALGHIEAVANTKPIEDDIAKFLG
ncbi:homoserine O-acetyltransferase [Skermanella stibiiresistens SB22]|uniref:Probable acyltransferase n=1 Tax=Skermanella stibiiresistens SB22 TaxID=1385369 RepID=W9H4D0_9PROT|nr:homoserine O-acetyltransferase [Skermanella stibiiresistens]EWY39577.1 homoserine O-acetyltransferase [Skermanella stibiiresistens SB22]